MKLSIINKVISMKCDEVGAGQILCSELAGELTTEIGAFELFGSCSYDLEEDLGREHCGGRQDRYRDCAGRRADMPEIFKHGPAKTATAP